MRSWLRLTAISQVALVWASGLAGSPAAAAPPATPALGKLVAQNVPAPPLVSNDLSGTRHRLQDYRGKVVLVNFWATWCEPCRAEMPTLQALKRRLEETAPGAFVILAVNYGESAGRVEGYLQKTPLEFALLLDPFTEVVRAWRPSVLPASYLIGRDGRVRYRVIGEYDWTGDEADRAIATLLR